MKFFSIITICKNNLPELKKTHHSIISQVKDNYEWIVIDGASTDHTPQWLESMNIGGWISEPDKGIYNAMNKGISKAKGKYLIFMNSGDCFDSNTVLSDCQDIIEQEHLPAFVYGDSVDVSEKGVSFYRKAKNHKKNWKGMITQHQAMFFSREKLGSLRYPEYFKLSGDYAFISSFLNMIDTNDILYLNFPICKYSMGGLNETKRFQALKEDFKIRREIVRLPLYINLTLYSLHYIHTVLKKANPSIRFVKHKAIH